MTSEQIIIFDILGKEQGRKGTRKGMTEGTG